MSRRRRGRSTRKSKSKSKAKVEDRQEPLDASILTPIPTSGVSLHHLHRYFEGAVVEGKLDPVLGNEQIRVGVFLNWVIGKNGTIVRGESGSCKTVMMKAIVSLIWGDEALDGNADGLVVLKPGSDKQVYTRSFEAKVNAATHCYIPEWQNAIKYEAMIKLWLEGRDGTYDAKDVTKKEDDVKSYKLPPRPVMTSLAEGNEEMKDLTNEMKRRVVSFYTRSDEALNEDVHGMKAKLEMLPDEELVTLSSEDYSALRAVIMGAMKEDRRVINPCADVVRKAVPAKYTSSNTFIGYWFDMIRAVTKFYRHDRPSNKRYLFATPGDNYVAYLLVSDVIRDLALGIPPLGNVILEDLPVAQIWGGPDGVNADIRSKLRHIDQIVDRLDGTGMPRSKAIVKDTMDRLVASGFAKQDDQKLYYVTKHIDTSPCTVDWTLLVEKGVDWVKQKYPTVAEEYEKQSVGYINPFTGAACEIELSPKKPYSSNGEKGGLSNV